MQIRKHKYLRHFARNTTHHEKYERKKSTQNDERRKKNNTNTFLYFFRLPFYAHEHLFAYCFIFPFLCFFFCTLFLVLSLSRLLLLRMCSHKYTHARRRWFYFGFFFCHFIIISGVNEQARWQIRNMSIENEAKKTHANMNRANEGTKSQARALKDMWVHIMATWVLSVSY